MTDLKPCPFCGDTEPLLGEVRHGDPLLHGFVVECRICSANVDRLESEDEAVEAWNTREGAQPTAQECDVANRLLDALMREAHGTTRWPAHWMAVRGQLIAAIRAAGAKEPK